MDKFSSLKELMVKVPLEHYSIEHKKVIGSKVLIISPHGGGIEFGTSDLGKLTALDDYSYFDFKGMLKIGNFRNLHVTSTRYRHPLLEELLSKSEITISLHGFKEMDKKYSIVGGLDEEGKKIIVEDLNKAGFKAVMAKERFTATNPENMVNRNKRGKGIQIEISAGQRLDFYLDKDKKIYQRRTQSEELPQYASVLRGAIKKLLKKLEDK